jgi:GNAT superfamily N-acetyltransferase
VDLVPAEGAILDEILSATFDIWHEGLSRHAYPRYYLGQRATRWGRAHLRRWALVDRGAVLASAKEYVFDAMLDGRPIRVLGLGAVFTQPRQRGHGHARTLITQLLERAAADRFDLVLLISEIGPEYYARLGFTAIPMFDLDLQVIEDVRRGAPATLVRAGEERDLADLASIDAARAAGYCFHLTRDSDLIQYAISKKRLLAGLSAPGSREVQFFIAEEGASAVAYVVLTVHGSEWTIQEAGDRDPAGARLGAILQALIARDPAAPRPAIKAWLPADLRPPQIRVVSERPSRDVMMFRPLTAKGTPEKPLAPSDVLWWHGDLF